MSIRYALFENHLTSDPDDYSAHVLVNGSVTRDDIVRRMVEQGSTVTKADIYAVMEDLSKAVESLLLEGFRVNFDGLFQLYPRIKGTFGGLTDNFDSNRHRIDVGATPGTKVRERIKNEASIERVESTKPFPTPFEFVDLGSGTRNDIITMGNIGTLNGSRLKFNLQQQDEGIFLINEADNSETRVTEIQRNKPGQLVFLIPSGLESGGTCSIEVRSKVFDNKDVRTGRLEQGLTLA